MIKILFYGDSHLGFDYPVNPRIDVRRRGEDFFRNQSLALEYAVENKADLVIHGGDLFFRTLIPPKIINRVYDELFAFADKGIPLLIVPGNHESSRLPPSLFLEHKNMFIFRRAQTYYFTIRGTSVAVSGFPCVRRNVKETFPDLLQNLASQLKTTDLKLICMHQAVEGSKVGPSDFTFRHGNDVIRFSDLTVDYDAYLSGHIHRQQILWKNFYQQMKVPVIYPGSIERTSFAEKDETKGFYMLHFDPDNSYNKLHNADFIELPTRPMVNVELADKFLNRKHLALRLTALFNEIDKNAIVRFKKLDPATTPLMTAAFLRSLAPDTISFQMGNLFRQS